MSQNMESSLSIDDRHSIETNQLGSLLGVYRLSQRYRRLSQWFGLTALIVGIMLLVVVIIVSCIEWYQSRTSSILDLLLSAYLFPSLLAGISGVIMGVLVLCIGVPRDLGTYVIVCERGLLQRKGTIRGNHVEIVYWGDIVALWEVFVLREYLILLRGGKLLTFSSIYQNLDELIELIRQRREGSISGGVE